MDKNGKKTSRWKKVDRLERLFDIRTMIRQMPKNKQQLHKKLLLTLDSEIIKKLMRKQIKHEPSLISELLGKLAKL